MLQRWENNGHERRWSKIKNLFSCIGTIGPIPMMKLNKKDSTPELSVLLQTFKSDHLKPGFTGGSYKELRLSEPSHHDLNLNLATEEKDMLRKHHLLLCNLMKFQMASGSISRSHRQEFPWLSEIDSFASLLCSMSGWQ